MNIHYFFKKTRRINFVAFFIGILILLGLFLIAKAVFAAVSFQDINPDNSSLDSVDPDGASGGRFNGLASVPGDNQIFYGASEWGGLYKTTDGGLTWFRLDGHLPVITWDVEVDPANTSTIYATSFYDGRVNPLSGIEVSYDSGTTWVHPFTAQPNDATMEGTTGDNTPQAGFSCKESRRTEPSAFGIGVRPDAPNNVFVGTNCGVAISNDSGITWMFVDPTPGQINSGDGSDAGNVWDVVVQAGGPYGQGIVDICGDDGHLRSINGGTNWIESTPGLRQSGTCSIAASPDESNVLFIWIDNNIYESDDGGVNWTNLGTPDDTRQGRRPFVRTNQRSDVSGDNVFDLWAGDVHLFRGKCITPSLPDSGVLRCPIAYSGDIPDDYSVPDRWAGPFTRTAGAHDDVGDIVFDTEAINDACPLIFSSDGGVYYNTDFGNGCHDPTWEQPDITPHALWLWAMDGADRPGDTSEGLYFGVQDNGAFGSIDAGALIPNWKNSDCCDVMDVSADASRVLYTWCCGGGRAIKLMLKDYNLSSGGGISNYPEDGLFKGGRFPDIIDQFGDKMYVLLTGDCRPPPSGAPPNGCSGVNGGDGGMYITFDITANPIEWIELGDSTEEPPYGPGSNNMCTVQASLDKETGNPVFYVQAGICSGSGSGRGSISLEQDQLWKFAGTDPDGTWQQIDKYVPSGFGIGTFAVDPTNADRLFASDLVTGGFQMVSSIDGGVTWTVNPQLDVLMTGDGAFKARTMQILPFERNPYVQPSLLAYDPEAENILVAGGQDSGVFLSTDYGQNWALLTDPFTSNITGIPHLPRPYFAYFDHEPEGQVNIYIGTRGRGVWRFTVIHPVADADGPYLTDEGVNIILDGSGSSDPGGTTLTYEWDLDDDGVFDDATGPSPAFDMVGQDGVFPIALKVTAGGVFNIDESTVTVNNVAPSLGLAYNAPANEGSPITVSGTVADPGWLDPVTATIDWGDGTSVETIVGVLENDRPDATLTFNTTHVYGDNGNFTAQVCGSDDDTTSCERIDLQVDNVNPTAEIDGTNMVLINGVSIFLARADEPLDFSGHSYDPGSDDLLLNWDWGDGPPSPDVTTVYLVNPPDPDPFPSPSVQPRDVTDMQTHILSDACRYEIAFSAVDDDGGSAVDIAVVLITGNADRSRSSGDWQHQLGRQGNTDFDDATLQCYLAIINDVSIVFDEVRDASSIEMAYDVLFLKQNGGSEIEQLDRELMTAWLNFANGAFEYDQLFDPDHDGVLTSFADIIAAAESVRLSPTSTTKEIREQKNILQQLR